MTERPLRRHCARAFVVSALLCIPASAGAQTAGEPSYRVGFSYALTHFDGGAEPWHLLSLEADRRSLRGTVVLRGNLARRFGQTGEQIEADAWPRFGPGTYGYLNVGYSPSGLFPAMRYGAELFHQVARGLELSAGARHLDFDAMDVTLYTASAGVYVDRYYLAARPYISRDDGEWLASGNLVVRHYSDNPDEWIGLTVGGGSVPADQATAVELDRQRSVQGLLEWRRRLSSAVGLRLSGAYEWEELAAGHERQRVVLSSGLVLSLW